MTWAGRAIVRPYRMMRQAPRFRSDEVVLVEDRRRTSAAGDPAWARWAGASGCRYTIGVEEELMLLNASDGSPAQCCDHVLAQLSGEMAEHAAPETHAAVMELKTGVHRSAAGAVAELSALRERLAVELRHLGVVAACAGMHPLGVGAVTRISRGERYRALSESMRFLALREPTLALHVHVGVPDPEDAVRLLNRLGENAALLLALSGNSPFSRGQDTGFCSTRTAVFGAFPRTGTPPPFASYRRYVDAIDPLILSGALPDPTFLWWDVRLQPVLGTVEIRVMDAQSGVQDSAALIGLIQSLARLELEGEPRAAVADPTVLAENRFLAARDGMDARLIDPHTRTLVPARTLLAALVRDCRPHAAALGAPAELAGGSRRAAATGAQRQRERVSAGGALPA